MSRQRGPGGKFLSKEGQNLGGVNEDFLDNNNNNNNNNMSEFLNVSNIQVTDGVIQIGVPSNIDTLFDDDNNNNNNNNNNFTEQ